MERLSPADYLDDPLTAHPRYSKIKDLNEGTFGVVVLAQDVRIKEPVRCLLSTCAVKLRAVCHPWHLLCLGQHGEGVSACHHGLQFALHSAVLCSGALLACLSQLLTKPLRAMQDNSVVCCLLMAPVVCAGSYKGVQPSIVLGCCKLLVFVYQCHVTYSAD